MKRIYFIRILLLADILSGLWTTLRIFFKTPRTILYPYERGSLGTRFRGEHALRRYDDGQERCIACKLCEVICPAQAITIRIGQRPEDGRRGAVSYVIDMHKCIFCGLCQDVCPVDAVVETPQTEFNGFRREDLIYDKEKLLAVGDRWEPVLREILRINLPYR